MERAYTQEEKYIRAQKKVKSIIGFYTHAFVTIFIVPFIIFINLRTVPQFHWFWFFIAAWFLGLALHWINVFGFSKIGVKSDWEARKLGEMLGEGGEMNHAQIKPDYSQELMYVKAKKKIKEIKGFYSHLIVMIVTAPVIVWVNLEFTPGFYYFWFALGGMFLSVFFHWLGVFGFAKLGFGKDWEQKKIQELMSKDI
jgi:hypothetical protein